MEARYLHKTYTMTCCVGLKDICASPLSALTALDSHNSLNVLACCLCRKSTVLCAFHLGPLRPNTPRQFIQQDNSF